VGKKAMKRQHVDRLTVENWHESSRTRVSCGMWMPVRIDETEDGAYRGIYGNPDLLGTEAHFDLLHEALAWANRDGGGTLIIVD
jgi:hypothetical protein